jgi:hypothetical protein
MRDPGKWLRLAVYLVIFAFMAQATAAQKKGDVPSPRGKGLMWESVNIKTRDLFYGPGGRDMQPDLDNVTFIKDETNGHNKKYRIKDGSGRIWVAKLGREAQPETASVRLLWALGYKTEINYLVPSLTIPGKGTFKNVRLEARPDDVERLDEWKWKSNPFTGTREFQGLKTMMVFFNNWDVLDLQNKVLQVNGKHGAELQYIISDLGSTFGRLGNNNLPVIYRLGRSVNKPEHYRKSKFVKGTKNGYIVLAYKGKNRGLFKGITVAQGRWLADLLLKLDDGQIRDAFRAANYSDNDIDTLTTAVKRRINELDRATEDARLGVK